MPAAENSDAKLVWILVGDKSGDNAQMHVLAKAAGLTPIEMPLAFNRLYRRSNLRLGATTRTLTDAARGTVRPPWPDVVFSSGRRSVPVARWIKRQSGGRTKLIHVGRPWGRSAWFDLVVAMPQYGVPDRPNVFQARMPFNTQPPAALETAAEKWRDRLSIYPRPWIGLLVGGKSKPLVLDSATAGEIARTVSKRARDLSGSVLALTSRRTGAPACEALFAGLEAPGLRYSWRQGDDDNPYLAVLALADEFVVTGDSASMLAEAVRTRRPLAIALLPRRPGRRWRRVALFKKLLPRWAFNFLVDLGIVTSMRDMDFLQRKLVADGLASLLPSAPLLTKSPFEDDLERVAAMVRDIVRKSD